VQVVARARGSPSVSQFGPPGISLLAFVCLFVLPGSLRGGAAAEKAAAAKAESGPGSFARTNN
jgi:hypothetical protein